MPNRPKASRLPLKPLMTRLSPILALNIASLPRSAIVLSHRPSPKSNALSQSCYTRCAQCAFSIHTTHSHRRPPPSTESCPTRADSEGRKDLAVEIFASVRDSRLLKHHLLSKYTALISE